jgi:hypothetical protein
MVGGSALGERYLINSPCRPPIGGIKGVTAKVGEILIKPNDPPICRQWFDQRPKRFRGNMLPMCTYATPKGLEVLVEGAFYETDGVFAKNTRPF